MKKNYIKPTAALVKSQPANIICLSKMEGPADPNVPVEAKEGFDTWNDED